MYIQPINSYNVSMQGAPDGFSGRGKKILDKIRQRVLDIFPITSIKNTKNIDKIENFEHILSKPAENRLIVGATALATQPAIDYYNHKVDEETRTVSRNRTIAKIVAGTGVGILVRGICYKLVEKMTDPQGVKKYSRGLLPKKHLKELLNVAQEMKNYRSAVATIVALLAMSITNFALDAPLTVFFTNWLNKKTVSQNKPEKNGLKEGIYV